MLTRKRILIAVAVIMGIPILWLAWYLLSPLFINKTVEEEFPLAAAAVIPADMNMAEVEQVMMDAASVDEMRDEAAPAEMAMAGDEMKMDASVTALKSGSFRDGDRIHKGSGTATIYRSAEGKSVLRLEDFSVTNGPDLRALLVPASNPQGRRDIKGYIELGKLKGNMGNQNYFLPESENPADYGSVVIYCKPFQVIFSVATLN